MKQLLESFMARPSIYNTRPFQNSREAQARENLRRSIDALNAGIDDQ